MSAPKAVHSLYHIRACTLLLGLVSAASCFAEELRLPLALDYRVLEQALETQLFTGPERTAQLYSDRNGCNTMMLSEPRVEGTDNGEVLIYTTITARNGTPIGKLCLLAKDWNGVLKTVHHAEVNPQNASVAFSVVDSTILRSDETKPLMPKWMQKPVMNFVLPQLDAVVINLQPAVNGIRELIDSATTASPEVTEMLSSLQIWNAVPSVSALEIVLSLQVPDAPVFEQPLEEAVFTEGELASWDSAWQAWDGFLTWFILTTAASADKELEQALAVTLLRARYDLRDALANDDRNHDPVRTLFLTTWKRLAPLLHTSQLDLPGNEALRFATFIAAGDALSTLDRVAPYTGLHLDTVSLRNFARMMVPSVTESELEYNLVPNPQLRRLLGLDPELEIESEPDPDPDMDKDMDMERSESSILNWFIPSAQADEPNKKLVRKLNGWVPKSNDLDDYLALMTRLLDEVAEAQRTSGKVPEAYFSLYKTMLFATAWQESCWRQFVEKDGFVVPIQSAAGSVGLMQVNKYVWRGVYDVEALTNNIGYNARAGNEILVHYLADYAIRKREHLVTGDADNLARATYAAYNGGPGQLSRYRKKDTNAALKSLDNAFWEKFEAIREHGPIAVKQCY